VNLEETRRSGVERMSSPEVIFMLLPCRSFKAVRAGGFSGVVRGSPSKRGSNRNAPYVVVWRVRIYLFAIFRRQIADTLSYMVLASG
jgi:hypothetical protein